MRRPGQPCPKCGRTGHCLADGCCCAWSGHTSAERRYCEACGHGEREDVPGDAFEIWTVTFDDPESLTAGIQSLGEDGERVVVSGTDSLDRAFLADEQGLIMLSQPSGALFDHPPMEFLDFPVAILLGGPRTISET